MDTDVDLAVGKASSKASTEASDSKTPNGGGSALTQAVVLRLLWAVTVFGALALLFRGLWAGFYIEPTAEALAEARAGSVLVGIACFVLVTAALYAALVAGWPLW